MNIYHNSSDEEIIGSILGYETEAKKLEGKAKIAKEALIERRQSQLSEALRQKLEPFGAVSTQIGDQKVTFTTPKKVTWDQIGLAQLFAQMTADGANASEYIKVEYKVSEDAYKNWPSNLREYFEPYRTVAPGNVSIKIEPAKEK